MVSSGDVPGIVGLARTQTYNCPGDAPGLGGPLPLCEGRPKGEQLTGIYFTIPQVGGALSLGQLTALLAGAFDDASQGLSDSFGGSGPAILSYGCDINDSQCSLRVAIVISWIGPAQNFADIDPRTGTRRFIMAFVAEKSSSGSFAIIEYSAAMDEAVAAQQTQVISGGRAPFISRFSSFEFYRWN